MYCLTHFIYYPFFVFGSLYHTLFYFATFFRPKGRGIYHHFIKYFKAMRDAVGGNLNPIHCPYDIWVPGDCGVAVSDDFLAICSENIVKEFSIPYLEKIGEEFGGVTVHSCGRINHLVKPLSAMKTLKALNFGSSETILPEFARECNPDIMLIVHKTGGNPVGGLPLLSVEEHIRLCKEVHKTTGVRIFSTTHNFDPAGDSIQRVSWEKAAML